MINVGEADAFDLDVTQYVENLINAFLVQHLPQNALNYAATLFSTGVGVSSIVAGASEYQRKMYESMFSPNKAIAGEKQKELPKPTISSSKGLTPA